MEEQEFEEILTYLSKNKYPENIRRNKDSRSNWRKKCRPFTYCRDVLYYNHKKYGVLCVVKGVKEKKKIIETSHLQSDGRHHGINRTLKKISTNYYWRTIAKDVHRYVKVECTVCVGQAAAGQQGIRARENGMDQAKIKIVDRAIEQIGLNVIGTILEPGAPSPSLPGQGPNLECVSDAARALQASPEPAPMVASPSPPEPAMARCGLDIVGPLSETHKGRRFLAVLTDMVTGWAEAVAISEATTEVVGVFVAEVVCRYGALEELVTRPSQEEFCVRLSERVCALVGMSLTVSAVVGDTKKWHNALLCEALHRLSSAHRYTWDLFLAPALLSYRAFPQVGRASCPFTLLYGRPPRLPTLAPPPLSPGAKDEVAALVDHMTEYITSLSAPPHHLPPASSLPLPPSPSPPHSEAEGHPSPNNQVTPFLPIHNPTTPIHHVTTTHVSTATTTTPVYTLPVTTTYTICAPTPSHQTLPPHTATTVTNAPGQQFIFSSALGSSLPVHTVTDTNTAPVAVIQADSKAYTDSFYVICPQ